MNKETEFNEEEKKDDLITPARMKDWRIRIEAMQRAIKKQADKNK